MTDPSEDRTTPAQPLSDNGLPTEGLPTEGLPTEALGSSGNQPSSGLWYEIPTQQPTMPMSDPWGESSGQSGQGAIPPGTQSTFGAPQPMYGPAQSPYDPTQPTFGPAQAPYDPSQSPYGSPQSPYGPPQSPYDATQPPFGGVQPPPGSTFGYPNQYPNPGQMPQPKSNSGRNAVAVVGTLAVVTALVVVLIVTNHHSNNNNAGPVAQTSSVASLTPTDTTSPVDTTTTEDTQSSPTAVAFDPNELNSASTDPTPFTTAALLPQSFSDSKNVPYSLQAGGAESCISSSMSSDVQTVLEKYGCTTKMTGSYTVNTSSVNSNDDILVSVQIFAFNDAATAEAVYASFPANGSWDFGIWCPKSGYGANPCSTNADYQDAYKSDWIGQDYRYVIEATALYTNMSQDSSDKAWTSAAADKAISATGPEYYISTQE